MVIVAGASHPQLAVQIAAQLSAPLIWAQTRRFADQELEVHLPGSLQGREIILLQSTCPPVHEHLMELLLLAQVAKRAGAQKITAVIPYMGYSRQDKSTLSNSQAAGLMPALMAAAGIDHILTVDVHSMQSVAFFEGRLHTIEAMGLFAPLFQEKRPWVVVSPDEGGAERAHRLASFLGAESLALTKRRTAQGEVFIQPLTEEVRHKDCILVDDIIDTGGTLWAAAVRLHQAGAQSVHACVTHGVFSGVAFQNIQGAGFTTFHLTNTILHSFLPPLIRVMSVAELLVTALKKL